MNQTNVFINAACCRRREAITVPEPFIPLAVKFDESGVVDVDSVAVTATAARRSHQQRPADVAG